MSSATQDVLATSDVVQRGSELVAALAVHDLHEALVLVVYDHRQTAEIQPRFVLEEVLVDADSRGPRVETRPAPELELLVEHALQKP